MRSAASSESISSMISAICLFERSLKISSFDWSLSSRMTSEAFSTSRRENRRIFSCSARWSISSAMSAA
jgi:hypothetical protein